MSGVGILQIVVFCVLLVALAYPLGLYMARVFDGQRTFLTPLLAPGERLFLRVVSRDGGREQDWKAYAKTVVIFSALFSALLYAILRLQHGLPLNPDGLANVPSHIALNTTASFVTNTNWQYYAGETTMSYLSQMAGLAVQNWISASVGIAVLAAVIRGFARRSPSGLGNFWVDLYRALAYVVAPLTIVLAVVLIATGVPQTFDGAATVSTLEGGEQTIARGPVASQIAIKHVGTNGGGFYNSNSSVPFESPTNYTGFLELLVEMLIPVACVFMFGRMAGSMRQGWAVFGAMAALFLVAVAIAVPAEQQGGQTLNAAGVPLSASGDSGGGNMEGKEVRYGIAESALFAVGTTVTSTGAVIAAHDSLTAVGGAVPIVNMFVGEVIFGGVGSGMYGILLFALLAVFIAGLMVGRTPEYLGKKIEAREIRLAMVGTVFVPVLVLTLTALSVVLDSGLESIFNPGAHGFSEALYAYTSQGNNNGSAFAGYGGTEYSASMGTIALYLGRFVPMIAVLAVAGSLGGKKIAPVSAGTFRTDGATFSVLLIAVILIVAGLTIFPALALGPVSEAFLEVSP